MKNIIVLGSGCVNCQTTMDLIEEVSRTADIEIVLEKVEDMSKIISYGVMSTLGVVVDGEVVHAGGIPSRQGIMEWLNAESGETCCSGSSGSGSCCG